MTPRTVSFKLPPHEREAMRGLVDAGLIPPRPQSFGEAFRASLTPEQREVIDDMAAMPTWERTAMLRHVHEYFDVHDELCDNLFNGECF